MGGELEYGAGVLRGGASADLGLELGDFGFRVFHNPVDVIDASVRSSTYKFLLVSIVEGQVEFEFCVKGVRRTVRMLLLCRLKVIDCFDYPIEAV